MDPLSFTKRTQLNKRVDTLYVCRPVVNAKDIIYWAKCQGLETTIEAADMHVTIAYSRKQLEWPAPRKSHIHLYAVPTGRSVKRLGDKGAVVLCFESKLLTERWKDLRQLGASWDHEGYKPHVTISYRVPDSRDAEAIQPYVGKIVLGPEEFKEVKDNIAHVEKLREVLGAIPKSMPFDKALIHYRTGQPTTYTCDLVKASKDLGLIFGWAIVSSEDGVPYYDTQGDHIPEDSMLEAATDFMLNHRAMKVMHEGKKVGKVVFAWPMTGDIADAMGIKGKRMGLMIAVKPDSPSVIQHFKDGKYNGFSIGGNRLVDEDVE